MMRRQILIDGIQISQSDSTSLTPKLLVAKANLAIDLMEDCDQDTPSSKPKEARIVSAKILGNKGVVLETSNEETVTWLRGRAKDFAAGMGGQAALKDRSLHLVVEFVPATLNEQLPDLLQAIEADNQLTSGSLISARWMRAPGNWRPDQKLAHAILTTNNIPTADSILKDGLVIEGCRLQARKLEEEPKRCFKCQKLSTRHTAANCQEITDWCSNCAGPHSVDDCRVTDRSKFACAGCRSVGAPDQHAAWDKRCPAYTQEKARILGCHPEYEYRYYITNEPWTWERKQDISETVERWKGNTHENRRLDPAWKGNAAMRSDSGWRGRLGPGSLRDAPTKTIPRRKEPHSLPFSTQNATTTSAPTPNPSQPMQIGEAPSRRANSRPRSRAESRNSNARRPAERPREPSQGTSRQVQSTIDSWLGDHENEIARESQKEWGNSQAPLTDSL